MALPSHARRRARDPRCACALAFASVCWGLTPALASAQWSGSVAIHARGYPDGVPGGAPHHEQSLTVDAERAFTWGEGSHILTVAPLLRADPASWSRSRFDFIELVWEKLWRDWEVAAGMKQVNWGVAESVAIVDVINQRDYGEDAAALGRLGQPLLSLRGFTSLGSLEAYLLPYFRERPFAGRAGTLWSPMPVETDSAVFEHSRGREHIDWALRWSHFVGEFDVGAAHFSGTNRDPRFEVSERVPGGPALIPQYDQIEQTSLDAQWTHNAWLMKVELLRRASAFEEFYTLAGGLEYAFAGYLSVFVEYVHDGRGAAATTSMENDVFVGVRLLTQDWTISSRAFVDSRTGNLIASATGSRRLAGGTTLELSGRFFGGDSLREPSFARRLDTYLALRFTFFL